MDTAFLALLGDGARRPTVLRAGEAQPVHRKLNHAPLPQAAAAPGYCGLLTAMRGRARAGRRLIGRTCPQQLLRTPPTDSASTRGGAGAISGAGPSALCV